MGNRPDQKHRTGTGPAAGRATRCPSSSILFICSQEEQKYCDSASKTQLQCPHPPKTSPDARRWGAHPTLVCLYFCPPQNWGQMKWVRGKLPWRGGGCGHPGRHSQHLRGGRVAS